MQKEAGPRTEACGVTIVLSFQGGDHPLSLTSGSSWFSQLSGSETVKCLDEILTSSEHLLDRQALSKEQMKLGTISAESA